MCFYNVYQYFFPSPAFVIFEAYSKNYPLIRRMKKIIYGINAIGLKHFIVAGDGTEHFQIVYKLIAFSDLFWRIQSTVSFWNKTQI